MHELRTGNATHGRQLNIGHFQLCRHLCRKPIETDINFLTRLSRIEEKFLPTFVERNRRSFLETARNFRIIIPSLGWLNARSSVVPSPSLIFIHSSLNRFSSYRFFSWIIFSSNIRFAHNFANFFLMAKFFHAPSLTFFEIFLSRCINVDAIFHFLRYFFLNIFPRILLL